MKHTPDKRKQAYDKFSQYGALSLMSCILMVNQSSMLSTKQPAAKFLKAPPPTLLFSDAGKNFTPEEFRQHAATVDIDIKEVPVEAHNSIGKVERYHSPLRRALRSSVMNSIAIDQQSKKIQPIDGAIDLSAKKYFISMAGCLFRLVVKTFRTSGHCPLL